MPLLTVLICTHNRVKLLSRALDSLNAAHRPPEGVQILVVANHCSDDTHQMLDAYDRVSGDRLALRWIAESTRGKSNALNRALPELNTPLVAFVDDDQRVDVNFLVAIRDTAHESPDADIICGRLVPDWDGSEPSWVHDQGRFRIYPLPIPHIDHGPVPLWLTEDVASPSGGNAIVRTQWIAKIGSFSTELGPVGHNLGGAEDSEWFLRAFRLGAKVRYTPAIVQRHYVDNERLTLRYLIRLAYVRTASHTGLQLAPHTEQSIPLWAYRKFARYAVLALISIDMNRRRFYLMRSASTLGEITAYRRLRSSRSQVLVNPPEASIGSDRPT